MKLINLSQIVNVDVSEENIILVVFSNNDHLFVYPEKYDFRDGQLLRIVVDHFLKNNVVIVKHGYEFDHYANMICEQICNDSNSKTPYKTEFLDQYKLKK